MVIDVVVKKEVTKLVEEVNKVLFKECNEGDHKVDGGGSCTGQEG